MRYIFLSPFSVCILFCCQDDLGAHHMEICEEHSLPRHIQYIQPARILIDVLAGAHTHTHAHGGNVPRTSEVWNDSVIMSSAWNIYSHQPSMAGVPVCAWWAAAATAAMFVCVCVFAFVVPASVFFYWAEGVEAMVLKHGYSVRAAVVINITSGYLPFNIKRL